MAMKFRLTAFSLHLLASTVTLSVIFGLLYLLWYRWPGWYLADVSRVVFVMGGVDLIVGPVLTAIVASTHKARRELARDIAVIVAIQLFALGYGSLSIWNGRPLYYAFSETLLQLVQAYDIEPAEAALGRSQNAKLAPHWYSLPRWVSAPLPKDAQASAQIVASAVSGGADVVSMPRYYQPWEQGLPTLRKRLKKVDDWAYFSAFEKRILKQRMQAAGIPTEQPNCMPFLGRSRPLLAVIDPATAKITALFKPR
jgi:hypothetical protein